MVAWGVTQLITTLASITIPHYHLYPARSDCLNGDRDTAASIRIQSGQTDPIRLPKRLKRVGVGEAEKEIRAGLPSIGLFVVDWRLDEAEFSKSVLRETLVMLDMRISSGVFDRAGDRTGVMTAITIASILTGLRQNIVL